MKPSSAPKSTSRTAARNATLLNLLATPGLGSLVARRWVEGIGQLILSVTGFILVVIWFVRVMVPYYGLMLSDTPPPPVNFKPLGIGFSLFALAWVWSLFTSLSLSRKTAQQDVDSMKFFSAGQLKPEETKIQQALNTLPLWQRNGEVISRTFQFKDFPAAMKFVTSVADLAEQFQHHPDIDARPDHA
jgi:hypothetical protein